MTNQIQTEKLEVDQSIRMEELTQDTKVGIANKQVSFVATVPRRAKRVLQEEFRREGRIKKFAPYTFASAVGEALRLAPFKSSDVIIDIEYPGYEIEILEIVKQQNPGVHIYFTSIGKKSPAHYAVYGVHIGKRTADITLTAARLLKIKNENKNSPRTVTPLDKPEDSQTT